MKKTYIKPEMEVEVVELEGMIAASPLSIIDDESAFEEGNSGLRGDVTEGKGRNDNWGGLLW